MMSKLLQEIKDYGLSTETAWSRDPSHPSWGVHTADPPPYNRLYGPVSGHAGPNGGVWRNGECLVQWGDTARPELTFSIAKTYLALLAGVAFDRGLLKLDTALAQQLPGIGFDLAQNTCITWRHLLQQTSEWEGQIWGIPEQVDHHRFVHFQPVKPPGKKGELRQRQVPGTFWEYNDVRINQLSLALLHLFRRPLADVFRETIAAPLGLSATWQWLPYDDAYVWIDGQRMPSVPGGSHWGGGATISSNDQALIGALLLQQGRSASGAQVLSEQWVALMRSPCAIAPFYGLLVWLNHQHIVFPSANEESFYAIGAGNSLIAMDPSNQTVTVARWINSDACDGLLALVRAV
jgi:CubicO group peptidase (beta-lactamase class C family)